MPQDNFWSRFRTWRRTRPFWGGFFLVLAALELLYTANMNLGNLEVHLGPQGFLSYLLPLLLLLCGVLAWFSPAQRVFYGIIGLLTALYTFVGLNLGGFFVGMLLGIVGGALVIAWGPPRAKAAPPSGAPTPDAPDNSDPEPTQPLRPAGAEGDTTIVPGLNDGRFDNPRALAAVLLATAVTGGVLVAGSGSPARAEECPEGLPSRTSQTSSAPASPSGSATPKPPPTVSGSPQPTPSASAPAGAEGGEDDEGAGNEFLDGIGDFFDGVGDLLGIGGKESPSPSPSESPTPSPTASPAAPAPATAATTSPARTESPTPTVSAEEIPCLGPRVLGRTASADDIPRVAATPGVMKVDSLTMYDSTYDGVVDMPTAKGTFKALKFSMDKAVNKPFTLTMDEPGRAQTVIKSNELVTDGDVKFYTPEFKGNLFGLIPVTFTPESPPPLTLPVLWFTKVTIKLAYVRCDTLTADPLNIRSVA
ncbi:DUF6114 domain-containing protein [Paractinoplanes brasiliensis]|uniref:Uncharacterized protein n=1 Tax=Paractinoplanes brasiliensis TaxID=52695 RepID=A0A4R6K2W9_9ACTN|nr:DUF6114 domain-containing protein [Actinoplanes brasiliensis]TDO42511.1 hypothetical protein C8E87_6284 [Actinoplanes brasiliensis]